MFNNLLKKKNIFNYLSCVIAVLAIVTMIIYAVYMGNGGSSNSFVMVACVLAIVCEVALFLYDGPFASIIGIVATVLLALSFLICVYSGIGNILDNINQFDIYGDGNQGALAVYVISTAVVGAIATLLSIVSCFLKKDKVQA